MKSFKYILGAALFLAAPASASQWVWGGNLINDPTLSYSTAPALDLNNVQGAGGPIDTLAMQAVYSVAQASTFTFTDGTSSTGTLTVLSTSSLTSARGSDTITVLSTGMPTSSAIVLQGKTYTANAPGGWSIGSSTNATATSIASLFNGVPGFVASSNGNVATITCASSGTFCNSIGLSVNTSSMTVASATFTGGRDNLVVGLGGYTVTAGTDFTPVATTSGTAEAIRVAFNSVAGIVALTTTTRASNVLYSTAAAAGTAGNSITWFTNSSSVTAAGFSGGTASAINTGSSSLTISTHGISTGLPLLFTVVSGTAPGSLVSGTTYYAILVSSNALKLASTQNNALAGTAVSITTQTARGGGSFTLKSSVYTGSAGFYWQGSNDGATFYTLPLSSTTLSTSDTATATQMWDGPIYYRYLRLNFTGPTTGGVNIRVIGNGKKGASQ